MRSLLLLIAAMMLTPAAWADEPSDSDRNRKPIAQTSEAQLANRPDFSNDRDAWRYRRHNGRWWYWGPNDNWSVWNGNAWRPFRSSGRYQTGYRGLGRDGYRYGSDRRWPGSYGYYGPGYYGRGYGPGGYYSRGANLGAGIGGAIGGRSGAGVGAAIGRAID